MILCVRMCVHVFCTLNAPVFDVPSLSWKGNMRTQDPQCCSHLCPLMTGQRLSRPNHGCSCHETHTHSLMHTHRYSPWPFIVVTAQLKPVLLPLLAIALMCSCYGGGWMCVIQRWRPCPPLYHSALTVGATENFGQHYNLQHTCLLTVFTFFTSYSLSTSSFAWETTVTTWCETY